MKGDRLGLVCPNGHAMDEGYLHCPACGAYRPPRCLRLGMTMIEQMDAMSRVINNEREAA